MPLSLISHGHIHASLVVLMGWQSRHGRCSRNASRWSQISMWRIATWPLAGTRVLACICHTDLVVMTVVLQPLLLLQLLLLLVFLLLTLPLLLLPLLIWCICLVLPLPAVAVCCRCFQPGLPATLLVLLQLQVIGRLVFHNWC